MRTTLQRGGNPKGKYLIINNNPSFAELQAGILGEGAANKILKKIFFALGVPDNELCFVTLMQHRTAKDVKPQINDYLLGEKLYNTWMEDVDPEKILICGSDTVSRLFETTMYKKRSMPFTYLDKPAICTYAPGYILVNNEFFIDLCEDITKLVHPDRIPVYDKDNLSTYTVMQSEDEVYRLLSTELAKYKKLAFDIETTGLDPKIDKLRCIGIGTDKDCYIIPAELFTDKIKKILEWLSRHTNIIAHFSNFEYRWMFELGCDIIIKSDTILKHHEVDERKGIPRSLKWLGTRYFNTPNWSEILNTENTLGFAEVSTEYLYPYLAHDVKITHKLDELFDPYVSDELYTHIMRARRVLSKLTHFGIPVDRGYLFDLYHLMTVTAERDKEFICNALDREEFNPRSAKMVSKILFEELGFPKIDGDSTGKKVMHQLRHMYPEETIISKIDDTRKLLSAQSTFVSGMYKATNIQTSHMYGEFRQDRTATGRLSSMDPNLQNIQRKGELGNLIRNALIPPKGYDWIVEADYSQIEVYFAAILSKDKAMIELLSNGGDIYRKAASEFYGVPEHEVTDEQREYFKPIILGSLYLRGPAAIAEQNHTSVEEETAKQEFFFNMYPDYKHFAKGKWMGDICLVPGALERAKKNKYVETMFGRKRRFPCILKDKEHEVRREALNAPIQGTASDVNLYALTEMYERAESGNFLNRFRPWNIIHDAVLVWITDDYKDECKPFMSNIMLNPPLDLPLKLKIDFKIGKRWGEMEKWKDGQ